MFSAGIGRTGTFIALDYILEEAATEQTVDVKGYVISLRHQRGKSIQTHVRFYREKIDFHEANFSSSKLICTKHI